MPRTTWGPLSTDEQNQIEFAPVGEPGVLAPGTAGALLKRNADGTMGNSILSESGSVLTAAGRLVIAGGTVTESTPVLDLSQTWNQGATTFDAVKVNVTDLASSSVSYLFLGQVGGSDRLTIMKSGAIFSYSSVQASNGFFVGYPSDIWLSRSAVSTIDFRAGASAGSGQTTWNQFGLYTDSFNYRRLRLTMTTAGAVTIAAEGLGTGVSGNTLALSQNGTTVASFSAAGSLTVGASLLTADNGSLFFGSKSRISSAVNGDMLISNQLITDADIFLKLGVNTSAAAGIKRAASSTVLQARLNDDSAFATIQGKLRTDNAYVAGAVVGTGYVTITDSTGTAYRVPVLV